MIKKGKKLHKNRILTSVSVLWLFVPAVAHALYTEPPGYYVYNDVNAGEIVEHALCPAGSFCPGFTNGDLGGDYELGIYSCDSSEPGFPGPQFTNSQPGSYAPEQCYYVNNDEEECLNINTFVEPSSAPAYVTDSPSRVDIRHYYQSDGDEVLALDTIGACAVDFIYCEGNDVPRSNGPLSDYIFQSLYTGSPYVDVSFNSIDGSWAAGYGSPSSRPFGEWEVKWPDGTLMKGYSSCSQTQASNGEFTPMGDTTANGNVQDADTEGGYCWCNLYAYKYHGTGNWQLLANDWVFAFFNDQSDPETCDLICPHDCTLKCADMAAGWYNLDQSVSNFEIKHTLYGEAGYVMNDCDTPPSTVAVTWYNQYSSSVYTTNTCPYGTQNSVTIPTAPTRTGYKFNGWNIISN